MLDTFTAVVTSVPDHNPGIQVHHPLWGASSVAYQNPDVTSDTSWPVEYAVDIIHQIMHDKSEQLVRDVAAWRYAVTGVQGDHSREQIMPGLLHFKIDVEINTELA